MSNSMKAVKLLARAAGDPDLRERLKSDPEGTARAEGVELHPHAAHVVLEDGPGLRHIVVMDDVHGSPSSGELSAEPSISDIRRWATWHVHAGDAIGDAIREDIDAAILNAGATSPGGLRFRLAVDDPEVMHMVVPFAATGELGLTAAETFAGGGETATHVTAAIEGVAVEAVAISTSEAVQVETSLEAAAEVAVAACEVEVTMTSTTVAIEVEVAIVPGFIT